jgi:hypothetical protein
MVVLTVTRYAAYRATVRIVARHYRPNQGGDELEARRELAQALNRLAQI